MPLVIRFPGGIAENTVSETPVISTDFFSTLLDFAGVESPETYENDGVSLASLLKGESELSRDSIYFHYPNYAFHRSNRLGSAVRTGKYKLIEWLDDGSVELYDLEADLSETSDLSQAEPERATEMLADLHRWRKRVKAEMPKPVTQQR